MQFSVQYPDRPLNRLTTFFRIFTVIPIGIVLGAVSGETWRSSDSRAIFISAGGLLFFAPLLMILFRLKYPRWWFDWNLELQRFSNRVGIYVLLMDDQYPSTDERQSVHLDYQYPDAAGQLNRFLPLVKWFLAIPHYVVLFFLDVAGFFVVIVAWFAILFTGRYPRGMFGFIEGVVRWHNRVIGYAFVFVGPLVLPVAFFKMVGLGGLRELVTYEAKDTPLHRLDPRLKVLYPVAMGILSILLTWTFMLGLFALSILPWFWLRPSMQRVRVLLVMAIGPALGGLWVQGMS